MCTYSSPLPLLMTPLLLVTILLPAILAAGEDEVPWKQLRGVAGRYLTACSSPETIKTLNRKLKERVAQRIADNSVLNEDSALRSLMLDWAASNEEAITRGDSEILTQACLYLVTFIDKGYAFPEQIRVRLNADVIEQIMQYMEGEITGAEPPSPRPNVRVIVRSK